jgi:K+-sensing histidine kinase KdpD
VLVLCDAPEARIREALGKLDGIGLVSWRLVVRGSPRDIPGVTFAPEGEWRTSTLAPMLRLALDLNRLERENAEFRGDILSIGTRIVHDMRTPLGGILVSCEAVNEELGDGGLTTRPIVESEEDLLRIVKRLALLTRAFAREPSLGVIAPDMAVMNAVQRIEGEASRRGVSVSYPSSFPKVVADPALLEAALTIYLENCLKHAPKGKLISVEFKVAADQVVFSVLDEGPGVDAGNKDLLFRPFFRLHEPNAPRGLGLPVVERIARMLGGRCGCAPSPKGGAAFWVSVPGDPAQTRIA